MGDEINVVNPIIMKPSIFGGLILSGDIGESFLLGLPLYKTPQQTQVPLPHCRSSTSVDPRHSARLPRTPGMLVNWGHHIKKHVLYRDGYQEKKNHQQASANHHFFLLVFVFGILYTIFGLT